MHYVDVNIHNMRQNFDFYNNNPGPANVIVYNPNTFVKNFLTPLNTVIYTKELF